MTYRLLVFSAVMLAVCLSVACGDSTDYAYLYEEKQTELEETEAEVVSRGKELTKLRSALRNRDDTGSTNNNLLDIIPQASKIFFWRNA